MEEISTRDTGPGSYNLTRDTGPGSYNLITCLRPPRDGRHVAALFLPTIPQLRTRGIIDLLGAVMVVWGLACSTVDRQVGGSSLPRAGTL